jgi:predicted 3-demethylubiquinone-9 3-methyltransferase (glyoxalase superfamily)
MQKITPVLWFDGQAEAAVAFYCASFRNARAGGVTRYPEGTPGKAGTVMTASFTLEGLEFTALNGGPHYQLSPAISFVVRCADQAEVNELWDRLADGGKPQQCGWITDGFGVTWQVVPAEMLELLGRGDAAANTRMMRAMMPMVKLEMPVLRRAWDGA